MNSVEQKIFSTQRSTGRLIDDQVDLYLVGRLKEALWNDIETVVWEDVASTILNERENVILIEEKINEFRSK